MIGPDRFSIVFISTMSGSLWGGSEELWAQSAARLAEQGFVVAASIQGATQLHPRVMDLARRIKIHLRRSSYPVWRRVAHKITHKISGRVPPLYILDLKRFLEECNPTLVVISNGACFPPVELAELCIALKFPFVTIAQANHDDWWPDDVRARQYRGVLSAALRCYFVADANRELAEAQIGSRLLNAEVVRNPFNAPYESAPVWPTDSDCLRMACVGRLHPPSKGQDLLLEALAQRPWDRRNWRLTLYGEGPNKESLVRLAERLHLVSRVEFRGHVDDVAGIWGENHLLVLPSRYEGLPLALVEAMLCARAALVTDVAGNGEVIREGVTGFIAESPTVPAVQWALERAWAQRSELQRMGEAAGRSIREAVPRDPVGVFVSKLRTLIDNSAASRTAAEHVLTAGQS